MGRMSLRIERYSDPPSFLIGLGELRKSGLTPRGLLFLALEPAGAIRLAVPQDLDDGTRIKVGDKLSLEWPLEGRFYHFDAIHRLRDNFYLFNGDRRLKDPGDAVQVAALVAEFLKGSSAKNVFFGCTEHQPGAWLVGGDQVSALHEAGFVGVVPVLQGLLARRVMDHRLWLRTFALLADTERLDAWQPIYESPFGNVLMVERRIIGNRLVLSCERGLVELDVSDVPRVDERARVPMSMGFAVVGRVENEAFAVTQGKIEPWGLSGVRPAVLIGAAGASLAALGQALAEAAAKRDPPAPQ
jgi:hypothetical protein